MQNSLWGNTSTSNISLCGKNTLDFSELILTSLWSMICFWLHTTAKASNIFTKEGLQKAHSSLNPIPRKVIALFCQEISSNQCERYLMLFVSKEKNSKHFILACHSSTRYPQLDSHGDAICTTTIEFLKRVDGNPKPYFDSYQVKRSLTLGCQEFRSN